MAVVFISPKQRQKAFFTGITLIFLIFLAVTYLRVYYSKPSSASLALILNKPKVNINLSIFDSNQFKNLQPFPEIETQYSYKATTKNRSARTGSVSAISIEKAMAILETQGLIVSELKEIELGRDNPFIPYYKPTIISPPPSTPPASTQSTTAR